MNWCQNSKNSLTWKSSTHVNFLILHKKVFSVKLSMWWQESDIFCNFCSTYIFCGEITNKAKTTDFKNTIRLLVPFSWVDFQRDDSLIGHCLPQKVLNFKSSTFSQTKKKETNVQKIKKYLHFRCVTKYQAPT